jgi:hypothetical protein
MRRIGMDWLTATTRSGSASLILAIIGVSVRPGRTVLTRTPRGARRIAATREMPRTPHLLLA